MNMSSIHVSVCSMISVSLISFFLGTLNAGGQTEFSRGNLGVVGIASSTLKISSQEASNLTTTGAQINGSVVDVVADAPSVYFCWDVKDRGTASTGNWAHVESVGVVGKGQSFYKQLTGLTSGQSYTYRCFAENTTGEAWSPLAIDFKPVYLPTIANYGARGVAPGAVLLQGAVTDTGSEPPHVWVFYWNEGGTTTNVVNTGPQPAVCDTEVSGLARGDNYGYMFMASNLAGVVYSGITTFTVASAYHVALDGDDTGDGLSWSMLSRISTRQSTGRLMATPSSLVMAFMASQNS